MESKKVIALSRGFASINKNIWQLGVFGVLGVEYFGQNATNMSQSACNCCTCYQASHRLPWLPAYPGLVHVRASSPRSAPNHV